MNFSQFLLILRMRWKIIVYTMLLTVITAVIVSKVMPKTYKATATLVLNYKGMDPITGLAIPAQMMPGYMATQVDIIGSKGVALKVVDDLKLAESPSVKQDYADATKGEGDIRDWLADILLKKLDVVPGRESSVLDVTFKGNNPVFSATVANAFASAYQQITIQLKVEPLKQATVYFNNQIKVLRDNLEAAQLKLSKYQQEKGIVNIDNRLDVETARLNDLSAQLVIAQGQRMEASSRRNHGASDSPDVVGNPLVQRLKEEVSTAESKLSEASEKYGTKHPQYIGAKAEVEKLRSSLNEQIQLTLNSVSSNERIFQQREGELRAALAAQKAKVLGINRTRDEQLAALSKAVETAQRAYDAATQRFNQTNIEGQANQSDVALLNPASPPAEAASPKILLNVLIAIILGSLLGMGLGMLAEILDRRVRSRDDLTDALSVPILGVIDWKAPRRRRSRWLGLFTSRRLRSN